MKYKVKYQEYQFKVCDGEKISSPEKLYEVLREDYSPISEEIYLLVLNTKNQLIDKYLIAKGGYNLIIVKPSDVFAQVLRANGRNFVLAHNHPSGDCTPSSEDITFTKKIEKASECMGLSFIDHLIYTTNDYYSFKKNGLL